MKKGMLSLEVTFLVVLGTIAVMVVVALITNWAFNINQGIQQITKDDKDEKDELAKLDISIYQCNRQLREIAKNTKLCIEKGRKGNLPMAGSCYLLYVGQQCNFASSSILQGLSSLQISANDVNIKYTQGDSKMYISYDYTMNRAVIE